MKNWLKEWMIVDIKVEKQMKLWMNKWMVMDDNG